MTKLLLKMALGLSCIHFFSTIAVGTSLSLHEACVADSGEMSRYSGDPDYFDTEFAKFKKNLVQKKRVSELREEVRTLTFLYLHHENCVKRGNDRNGFFRQSMADIEKKVSLIRDRILELTPPDPALFERSVSSRTRRPAMIQGDGGEDSKATGRKATSKGKSPTGKNTKSSSKQ